MTNIVNFRDWKKLNEQTAGGLYTPKLSKELHELAFNAQSKWSTYLTPDEKAKWLKYASTPAYHKRELGTSYPVELKLLLFKDLEGTIPSDNNQLAKLGEKDWKHVRNFIKWASEVRSK